MAISSRTPEGFPARCGVCGAANNLEFSDPGDDAPCPACGQLLRKSGRAFRIAQSLICARLNIPPKAVTPDTPIETVGEDSLARFEVMLVLEEFLRVRIPDDAVGEILTIGDLVRFSSLSE